MKINCTQGILLFISLCIFLFISENGFTYSASKHHRHMGERATVESDLDRYLKDNLGFSNGINTTLTNPDEPIGEQTKKIYEWIGHGAAEEDDLFPIVRVVYHFYDPVSNLGLSDYAPFLDSSLVWGNDAPLNDYSWVDVREYYYLALTSETKEEREQYWALTFRSLGQVLHLVQDLASPAHVRNDNHLSLFNFDNDPYEDIWGTSPEGIFDIIDALDIEYPVVHLDEFDDYWDSEDGRGLAEFTNSNFVSKDTNVDVLSGRHHYDNPQPTGLHREPFEFTDSNNVRRTVNVTYYTSNVVDSYAPGRSVNPFNYLTAVSPWNFYTGRYDPDRIHYTLNRKCHEEYAKLLVPRTVGYGAGLLNYFFRGRLGIESFRISNVSDYPEVVLLEWDLRNYTNEDLFDGSVNIFCKKRNGDVELVTTFNIPLLNGAGVNIPFEINEENGLIDNYIVVYKGGHFGEEEALGDKCLAAKVLHVIYPDENDATSTMVVNGVGQQSYFGGLVQAAFGYSEDPDDGTVTITTERGNFKFNTSHLSSDILIKRAYLILVLNSMGGGPQTVHRIVQDWSGNAGIIGHLSYDSNAIFTIPTPTSYPDIVVLNTYIVDITDLFQGWVDGSIENNGIMVKWASETHDESEGGDYYKLRQIFLEDNSTAESTHIVYELEQSANSY